MPRPVRPLGPLALVAGLLALASAAAQPVVQPVGGARVVVVGGQPAASPEPAVSDEEALKQAGLSPTDGAKLVGYLKQRTVSDTDQGKIQALIKQFTADKFDDRLAAAAEVELFGPAAIGPLKAAERDTDPEVSYRATQVLKKLEKIPHAAVAAAAVRAVVKLKPPGAAPALLGFLPLADSEVLAEEIRGALVALAVRDGKAEPALVAALTDPSPLRRATAYVALVEGGPPGERVRIKDVYPQVKEAVRKETDPDARFRGLWALVRTTREKEFVPDLVAMIPTLPRGRIWQLEEFLLQLAGDHPEGGRFGKSPESLTKARDAWAAWWDKKGGAVDLVKLDFKPRIQGFTDLVEYDQRGFGMGRVVSLGPDLKEKWQLSGVRNPTDARVLPTGNLLVIENYNQVNEREVGGRIVSTKNLNQPLSTQPLADGGLLVVCRPLVVEFDKQGKQVAAYPRPNSDILAGRRLPNGETVFVTNAPQGPNCYRLDAKLKEVGKPIALGRIQNQALVGMDVIGEDKILVCEFDKVVEYDLKTAKAGWKYPTAQPTSVQRLPNGNTLIASLNQNKAIEVDPAGEVVWEYQAKDGLRVARAYRR
jgi:hypothetical protein